jgi:aminoglycoside 2''-phosphotransferase
LDPIVAKYEKRIREACPDLVWSEVEVNRDGLINDVIVINHEVVFRFARGDEGIEMFARENRFLDTVRPHLSIPIPDPIYASRDAMAYRRLPGEAIRRDQLASLDEATQQRIADDIAGVLRELHRVPVDQSVPPTGAPTTRETWLKLQAYIEQHAYPRLMTHQRAWAEELFERCVGDPGFLTSDACFVHGDLGFYHLLFDQATWRLSGLIDFGTAGVGDPAIDVAPLLQAWGASFVGRLAGVYPEVTEYLPRARFYAQGIELMWAATGLARGEKRWFLAHLGGARDLGK